MEKPKPYMSLGWTPDQKKAFDNLKSVRPDLSKRITDARDVLFSASKHDPHEVLKARNILNSWEMMPSVFEVKNERK